MPDEDRLTSDDGALWRAIATARVTRAFTTLARWWTASRTHALVTNRSVQRLFAVGILAVSVARVTASELHVALKFASFAVIFAIVALFVWPFADPTAE